LNTAVWEAIEHQSEHGIVIGVGNCASALCDPMIDPRGGALGLGLGLISSLTAIVESEQWPTERMLRTRKLAQGPLAIIPTGSGVVYQNNQWITFGNATLVNEGTQDA